jgi:hypothetical protein
MKRKELAAGLTLLALVSSLCLAGLRAIDNALAEKERKKNNE